MNTIIDLNNAANVSYNLQSDYQIVFGNSLGNATVVVDPGFDYAVAQQVPITTLANCVRDVLVDFSFPPPFSFSTSSAANVTYTGPYGNIGILKINSNTWRATGIRDINRYDELFANTVVRDGNLGVNYTFTTTVNDQYGNTRTWSTDVTSLGLPTISVASTLSFDEDVYANTGISLANVSANSTASYTFTANAGENLAIFNLAGNLVTDISLTNTASNISNSIANLQWLPPPDKTANAANITYRIERSNIGTLVSSASQTTIIANTHAEYNWTTSGVYNEDDFIVFGNVISDLYPLANSYSITIQQTAGNVGSWYVNNVLYGNSDVALNLSNTKTNINSANVKFFPGVDNTSNLTFTYSQSRSSTWAGNTLQASNVEANYTCNTNPEISNMIDRDYTSNTVTSIFSSTTPYINDGPNLGQTYTITLTSPIGRFGNTANNAIASSSYSFTGNLTSTNNEFGNIVFVPEPGPAVNSTYTYTQSRNGILQKTITANLTGLSGSVPDNLYTIETSGTWSPTFDQYYYGNALILVVGGGGGGARGNAIYSGGSGGAGGIPQIVNFRRGVTSNASAGLYALTQGTYTIEIGAGGAAGSGVSGAGGTGGITYFESPGNVANIAGSSGIGAGGPPAAGASQAVKVGGTYFGLALPGFGGGGAGGEYLYLANSITGGSNGSNATSSGPGSGGNGYTFTEAGIKVGGGGAGAGRFSDGTVAYGSSGGGSYAVGGRGGESSGSAEAGLPGVVIIKFI